MAEEEVEFGVEAMDCLVALVVLVGVDGSSGMYFAPEVGGSALMVSLKFGFGMFLIS